MTLRTAVLVCVKLTLCLAYFNNTVSVAGLAPLFLFAPVLLGLAVVQLLFDPPSPSMPGSVKLLQITLIAMLIITILTPIFFGLGGSRPRAIVFSVLMFSLVLIVGRVVRSTQDVHSILNLIRWLTAGLILIGVVEVLTGLHLPNSRHYDPDFIYKDPTIPTGTVYNENQYATLVLLGVPLFLAQIFDPKGRFGRIFAIVMIVLSVFVISQTDSRLNLLGLALTFMAYLWVSGATRLAGGLTLVVILSVILVAVQPGLVAEVGDRVFGQFETLSIETFTNTNSAEAVRLNLAFMTFDIMAEYPLTGYGAGGAEAFCDARNYETFGICVPHNWPLEMASNFGVPLAVLNIVAILTLLMFLLRHGERGTFRPVFVALFACTIVANFTASSILVLAPIWVVLGLLLAYGNIIHRTRKAA